MAVAFDASSEGVVLADPQEHTHTPVGTPAAAIALIGHGTVSTDIVNTVTYGGTAMARVSTNLRAGGEPGRVYVYFLGASVPTGAQTISVDRTEGTTEMSVVGVTLTASANTEVVDFDGLDGTAGAIANPSVTLNYGGRTCIALGVLYTGHGVIGDCVVGANMTAMQSHDLGNFAVHQGRQTTPGTTDFAFGYTQAAEDTALTAVAISEVLTFVPYPVRGGSMDSMTGGLNE
jgi:hypothetical protein